MILRTQRESIEREPFQYLSLAEIQAESLLGPQLIDHILVFENYPLKQLMNNRNKPASASLRNPTTILM